MGLFPGEFGAGAGEGWSGSDSRTWSSCLILTVFLPQCDGNNYVNWLEEVTPCYYFRLRATPTIAFAPPKGTPLPCLVWLRPPPLLGVQPLEGQR